MDRRALATVATFIAVMAAPGAASAATQLGETITPNVSRTGAMSYAGTGPPSYAAPSPGVITSWAHIAPGSPTTMRFKVARPAGGDNFTVIGNSDLVTPDPFVLNTFATRIPVQAGDVIGFYIETTTFVMWSTTGTAYHQISGDPAVGSTDTWTLVGAPLKLDLSATLEPDIDNDGFGDETQDCAPDDASRHDDCAPPQTEIHRGPKDKTRKKRATFEFTSSEPGATFHCALDTDAFTPCASPFVAKVKKGWHRFQVRAIDAAGNLDATPAFDVWKVKKKKRK
jgi:hypothetical protein